jgi:hypothetical protein
MQTAPQPPTPADFHTRLDAHALELYHAAKDLETLDPPCPFHPSDGRCAEWFAMWRRFDAVISAVEMRVRRVEASR